MIKYVAYPLWKKNPIEKRDVARETEYYVFDVIGRHKKVSDYESYFDTFEEAKAHIVGKCQKFVADSESELKMAQAMLEKAEALHE